MDDDRGSVLVGCQKKKGDYGREMVESFGDSFYQRKEIYGLFYNQLFKKKSERISLGDEKQFKEEVILYKSSKTPSAKTQ